MWKSASRVPLCEFYPGLCLTTEEKSRKNLSQGKKNLSQVNKNIWGKKCLAVKITGRITGLYT